MEYLQQLSISKVIDVDIKCLKSIQIMLLEFDGPCLISCYSGEVEKEKGMEIREQRLENALKRDLKSS